MSFPSAKPTEDPIAPFWVRYKLRDLMQRKHILHITGFFVLIFFFKSGLLAQITNFDLLDKPDALQSLGLGAQFE
jgi:hypothetical protein